jgi:hypothetical protein
LLKSAGIAADDRRTRKEIDMNLLARGSFLLVMGAAIAAAACGGSPSVGETSGAANPSKATPETTSAAASAPQGIQGTLLYSKKLGPEHVIEFYEFGPGVEAIHESLSMDAGEIAVDKLAPLTTLAELYIKLNPEANEVPAAIAGADERTAMIPQVSQATPDRQPPSGGSAEGKHGLAPANLNCSADRQNDGWSANWFMDNYCNAGSFRWCNAKNWGAAYDHGFSTSWASWRQLEGDYNVGGHITGMHCNSCWPFACGCPNHTDFDYDTLPRHIEIWNYQNINQGWVDGSSQCGHLDVAFLWN